MKQKEKGPIHQYIINLINVFDRLLIVGIGISFITIIGYTLSYTFSFSIWKLTFLILFIAEATFMFGFFLGFLFGIPKRKDSSSEKDNNSEYEINNSLYNISEWLTKIIIGIGLVEIRKILNYLYAIGEYVRNSINGENSITVFVIACIVYLLIFGFYYGYKYTKLHLSGEFKHADDAINNIAEDLNKIDISLPAIGPFNFHESVDSKIMKKISDYNILVRKKKTEDNYSFEDWFYQGIEFYNNGEYEKVIAWMRQALEKVKTKNTPEACLYIAESYYLVGLKDKSIETFYRIISDYPNFEKLYKVYYDLGVISLEHENYEDGLRQNDYSILLKHHYKYSWNNKAYALNKLNRWNDALEVVEEAFKRKMEQDNLWVNKGYAYMKLGYLDDAIIFYNKALDLNQNNKFALYDLARTYSLKDDKENMIKYLRKAIDWDETCKYDARNEHDFKKFWNDEDFKKIVA